MSLKGAWKPDRNTRRNTRLQDELIRRNKDKPPQPRKKRSKRHGR